MARRQFEGLLQERGVETDAASLARALEGSADEVVRRYAAVLLGIRRERGAIPSLRRALVDRAPLVRLEAASALAGMDDSSGTDVLREGLASGGNREHRIKAATSLARLGDSRGYPVLTEALLEDSPGARMSAIDGLRLFAPFEGQRSGEHTINIAQELGKIVQSDPHRVVRLQAVIALGDLCLPGAQKALEDGLKDSDEAVKLQARAARERCQSTSRDVQRTEP